MKRNYLLPSLALAAIGILLVALPGSSQQARETTCDATASLQAKLDAFGARIRQASAKLNDRKELLENLQNVEELQNVDDEQDVEVYVGDGGGWIGVEAREVTEENVKALKLPSERGALVGKVIPDSPAAKAGLKENDVITEINGQRVEGTAQFRRLIHEIPSGRTAQLTVMRQGSSQTINVTLGKMQPGEVHAMRALGTPGAFAFQMPDLPVVEPLEGLNIVRSFGMGQPRLGIDAEDLRGELGNYFGAPDGEGILVRSVFNDSPAAKAGLKAGDVITGVNGKRVRTVRELREEMRQSKDESKSLRIGLLRNKAAMTLDLQLPPLPPRNEVRESGERVTL